MNFGTGNDEEKSDGCCICKILINIHVFCCASVVRARNHDYGKDADVRLFDREKSSDFSEDLPHHRATEELEEGNDCGRCCQCPECCW